MGNPVALLASALERLTRGFISMTTISKGFLPVTGSGAGLGLTPNWTLLPPVSTPTARMMAMAASRIAWYSLSVSVRIGATVMESPVWTPMASRFSMPQTMTQLSLRSRTTSSSYSFQPMTLWSIWTCLIMLAARPRAMMSRNSSMLYAMPPPVPPSVKAGRRIAGRPMSLMASIASSMELTTAALGSLSPIDSQICLKAWRSSARWMTSRLAPIISMPNSLSVPLSHRAQAQLSAVWPPRVGRIASILGPRLASSSMILRTASGVMGSMYVRSEKAGSVMIVAGLLFTRTMRYPSALSVLQACVPL